MSECVRRNHLADAGLSSILLDIDKQTDTRQGAPTAQRDKHMVGKPLLRHYMATNALPALDFAHGTWRDRYQTLLAALTLDTDKTLVEKEVSKSKRNQFANTQAARV